MYHLQQFTKALMNYVINDTKTSAETVMSSLQEYKQFNMDHNMIEEAKTKFYMDQIELPRLERERLYQEYVEQKNALRITYTSSPNYGALRDWLLLPIPDSLKEMGVREPYIYTKNIVVK